jgi:hypothetical protein
MQRMLFVAILSLSLMVCLTSPVWAGGLDDSKAGSAFHDYTYDKAIGLYTKAIESGELSREIRGDVYYTRGLAWYKRVTLTRPKRSTPAYTPMTITETEILHTGCPGCR